MKLIYSSFRHGDGPSSYQFLKSLFFKVCLVVLLIQPLASYTVSAQLTRGEAKLAMQAYNNAFYRDKGAYGPGWKAIYEDDTYIDGNASPFWEYAEEVETLIDAYHVNPDAEFKDRIQRLYNGFRDKYGTDWSWNEFNDDLVWGALMCIRAYQITNDGGMRDLAIANFERVWNRSYDTQIGGGMWWKTVYRTGETKGKYACVAAPAAICAMFLYHATGDSKYLNRASSLMEWMKSRLFVASTGELKGAIDPNGVIFQGARTYTQGTFIGAANELHRYFPTRNYLRDADMAMWYTRYTMSNSAGLLPDEYCGTRDCPGFKGVFARWACKYVKDQNQVSRYGTWLNYNANQAWRYRNSSGLMWAQWWRRTPDGYLTSFEASSGVSMVNNVFLFNGSVATGRISLPEEIVDNGINKSNLDQVFLFPNPVQKSLVLKSNDALNDVDITIVNSKGVTVLKGRMKENEINVETLPVGIYSIILDGKNKKITKTFIKQ